LVTEYSGMSSEGFQKHMSTARVLHEGTRAPKMTKREAARRLAELIERNMERKGLSEDKRNARVQRGIEYVDKVIASRDDRSK